MSRETQWKLPVVPDQSAQSAQKGTTTPLTPARAGSMTHSTAFRSGVQCGRRGLYGEEQLLVGRTAHHRPTTLDCLLDTEAFLALSRAQAAYLDRQHSKFFLLSFPCLSPLQVHLTAAGSDPGVQTTIVASVIFIKLWMMWSQEQW